MVDFTETVRSFIEKEMMTQAHKGTLSPSDSLIDKGIVDSLGVQRLIAYLEQEFDLQIADTEIVPENFETIGSVVNFINYKLTAKG
ncbi:acyl carrier protein [Citrifermentans bemidjiense Bem]|jgi:acyl carrier protein|uniref:Acyl carrier protein n=2 Tax=Geobacteraceae TaxID=213422 RepID=B5ECE8_CITBB|nr:acyl carrier protein [Citrifermentans bemidjiense]ACH37576.1 acyl carrier protein [Citrifermentans bemidjiense Bem]